MCVCERERETERVRERDSERDMKSVQNILCQLLTWLCPMLPPVYLEALHPCIGREEVERRSGNG